MADLKLYGLGEDPTQLDEATDAVRTAAATVNPDEVAQDRDIAKRLGVEPSPLGELRPVYRAAADGLDQRAALEGAPVVQTWMREPKNAAVSHDDVQGLTDFEKLVGKTLNTMRRVAARGLAAQVFGWHRDPGVQRELKGGVEQFAYGVEDVQQGRLGTKVVLGQATPQERAEFETRAAKRRTQTQPSGFIGNAARVLPQIGASLERGAKYMPGAAVAGAATGAALGGTGGAAAGAPAAGVGAVPGAAVGATGGAIAGFGVGLGAGYAVGSAQSSFEVNAGLAYEELIGLQDDKGNKIDPEVARVTAIAIGAINAPLDVLGEAAIAKVVGLPILRKLGTQQISQLLMKPSVAKALQRIGKQYAGAVGAETVTEMTQQVVQILGREAAKEQTNRKAGANFKPTTAKEATAEVLEAGKQAAMATAVIAGAGAGPRIMADTARVQQAQQSEALFNQIAESAANSNLRTRDPEAYSEVIQQVGEANGATHVYVDAEKFVELFQSRGEDAYAEAEKIGLNRLAIEQAARSGGDIAIPIGEYAAKLAGTEADTALRKYMKFDPEALSLAEAEEVEANLPEVQKELERQAKETGEEEAKAQSEDAGIEEEVFGRLRETGKYDDRTARALAKPIAAAYRALGQRVGKSPTELKEAIPLPRITGGTVIKQPNVPQEFVQSIRRAEAETGVSASYLATLGQKESGFRPKVKAATSSATGIMQFTDGTWLKVARKYAAQLGLDPNADDQTLLAARTNADLNIRAGALLTLENQRNLLKKLGRQPTDAELYMAHFMGPKGATALIQAAPDANARELFPKEAKANPAIFGTEEKPRTVAEVRNRLAQGFAGGGEAGRRVGIFSRLDDEVEGDAPSLDLFQDQTGTNIARSLAEQYRAQKGLTTQGLTNLAVPDEAVMMEIADAFEAAQHQPAEPATQAAYRAMVAETMQQYEFIGGIGLKVEAWTQGGEPYPDSTAMMRDVLENGHLWFFPTDNGFGTELEKAEGNVLLEPSGLYLEDGRPLLNNDVFRIVHDFFAHVPAGLKFGPKGELNAFLEHASMYSAEALPAVAAETLMQNAWVNFGPHLRRPDGTLPKRGDPDYTPIPQRRFADQKNFVPPQEVIQRAFQLRERADESARLAAAQLEQDRGEPRQAADEGALQAPPVEADGTVRLYHWSLRRGLKSTNPNRWGDNYDTLPPEEKARIGDAPPRTYFGIAVGQPGGYDPRADGAIGPHPYTASIPMERLYDYAADPDQLKPDALAKAIEEYGDDDLTPGQLLDRDNMAVSFYETAIKEKGWAGYWINDPQLGLVAAVFERVKVKAAEGGGLELYQSAYDPGLGFRSMLHEAVMRGPGKAAPDQWAATLQNVPGLKKEELEATGILDYIAMFKENGDKSIPREALAEYVSNNGVVLEERILGEESDDYYDDPDFQEIEDNIREQAFLGNYSRPEISVGRYFSNPADPDDEYVYTERQPEFDEDGELIEEPSEDRSTPFVLAGRGQPSLPFGDRIGEALPLQHDPNDRAAAYYVVDDEDTTSSGTGYRKIAGPFADQDEAARAAEQYEADHRAQAREEFFEDPDPYGNIMEMALDEWRQNHGPRWSTFKLDGGENYREVLIRLPREKNARYPRGFDASHWSIPDIMAHARVTDRTTVAGEDGRSQRVLFIEEVQSDWHQKGRDRGYAQTRTAAELEALSDAVDAALTAFQEGAEPFFAKVAALAQAEADQLKARIEGPLADAERADTEFWNAIFKKHGVETLNEFVAKEATAEAEGRSAFTPGRGLLSEEEFEESKRLEAAKSKEQVDRGQARHAMEALNKLVIKLTHQDQYGKPLYSVTDRQYAVQSQIDRDILKIDRDPEAVALKQKVDDLALRHREAKNAYDAAVSGIADAPFKNSWPTLVMKRMIRMAVEEGYDAVAFTRGDLIGPIVGAGEKAEWFYERNLINITNDLIKKSGQKVRDERIEVGYVSSSNRRELLNNLKIAEARVAELKREGDPSNDDIDRVMFVMRNAARERGEFLTDDPAKDGTTDGTGDLAKFDPEYNRLLELSLAYEAVTNAQEDLDGRFPNVHFFELNDKLKGMVEDGFTLFQGGDREARGSIRIPEGGVLGREALITLGNAADPSTFLHESAHFFLEMLKALQTEEGVQEDIRVLKEWFNVPDLSLIGRDEHERFAEAFEQYLYEGRTPALRLQSLFERFRAWMLMVYRAVKQIAPITPEVRGVFDRLLATDEEIRRAREAQAFVPLFQTEEEAKAAGMTDQDWLDYQRLVAHVQAAQQAKADARVLAIANRTAKAWWQEAMDEVRAEVEAELDESPVRQAFEWFANSRWRGGGEPPVGLEAVPKLSRQAIVDDYGAERLKRLPRGRNHVYAAEGGVHPDVAAEVFGFGSGEELLSALETMPRRADAVEAEAQRRMAEQYPDPLANMPEVAQEALHGPDQNVLFEVELRHLMGQRPSKAMLHAARQAVQSMTVKELMTTDKHLAAERRAGNAALKAMKAGDLEEATLQKHRQLVAYNLWRAAREANDRIEKHLRYVAKFDRPGTRKAINPDYLEQIDGLLEQYDFSKRSQKELRRRAGLNSFVARMIAEGREDELNIPPELLDRAGQTHFSTLTLEELNSVIEAIRNLDHLGRTKRRLLSQQRQRDFDRAVDELVSQAFMADIKDITFRQAAPAAPDAIDKFGKWRRKMHAQHTRFEFLFRRLDGLRDNGPWWNYLFRPLADASALKAALMEDKTVKLRQIMQGVSGKWLRKRHHVPAISRGMLGSQLMAFALNMGNEGNVQAMMEGYGWSEDQIEAVKAAIPREVWDATQRIWDLLEELRPMAFQLEKDITGSEPEPVLPTPVQTPHGIYRGGYYPLVYDRTLALRVDQEQSKQELGEIFSIPATRPMTRKGHLINRVGSGGRPVKLQLSVLSDHLEQVIHDTSYRRAIIDIDRLTQHPLVQQAIELKFGREALDQVRPWLKETARPRIDPRSQIEMLMTRLRQGSAVVNMGLKLSTMLVQPLGIFNAIPRLGPRVLHAQLRIGPQAFISRLRQSLSWLLGEGRMPSSIEFVMSRSELMRARLKNFDRDANDIIGAFEFERGKRFRQNVAKAAFYGVALFDLTVSTPVWVTAYELAREGRIDGIDPMNEEDIIAYADSVVRMTVGAGETKDLPPIMRETELRKLFTGFYGFFSILYNQLWQEQAPGFRAGIIGPAQFAANMLILTIVPAFLSELLIRGGFDEDDDGLDEEDIKRGALRVAAYPLSSVVVVRDVVSFGLYAMDNPQADYTVAPSLQFFDAAAEFVKAAFLDDQADPLSERAIKNLWLASGYWFGLPARQLWMSADYLSDYLEGEEQEFSVHEFLVRRKPN